MEQTINFPKDLFDVSTLKVGDRYKIAGENEKQEMVSLDVIVLKIDSETNSIQIMPAGREGK